MTTHVKTLNKIHKAGLEFLKERNCLINQSEQPELILVRSEKIELKAIPQSLQVIARAGAGVNNIPVAELTKIGIPVINTPGANATAVRDIVFGSLICLQRNLIPANQAVTLTNYDQVEQIKSQFSGNELINKTMLVIGLGAIGELVAKTAIGFGMHVTGFDPFISSDKASYLKNKGLQIFASINDACKQADIISLHVPLNEQNRHIINAEIIATFANKPIILNFSRSGIVDDTEIKQGINNNLIQGYITDFPTKAALESKQILCLPHIGAASMETEQRCALIAADKAWQYLKYGAISNSVNFPNMQLGPPEQHRLCLIHHDQPNTLSMITSIIGAENINIAQMHNAARSGLAYTVLDLEQLPDIKQFEQIPGMIKWRSLACKA